MMAVTLGQLQIGFKKLDLNDLKILSAPHKIENGFLILDRGIAGKRWKHPVQIPLEQVLIVGRTGLVDYILTISQMTPKLIPFIFKNRSMIEVAASLYRHQDGERPASTRTLHAYVDRISRYCQDGPKLSPDELLADLSRKENRIDLHIKSLQQYLDDQKERGVGNSWLRSYVWSVEKLYRVNGFRGFHLVERYRLKKYLDSRIVTDEEVQKLLLHADVREKVILSLLMLTGLREGTVASLKLRHVIDDLRTGVIPLHIHIGTSETKGGYAPYDTFYGTQADPEPILWLKAYLDLRRRGTRYLPPEKLDGSSPLIRTSQRRHVRPIAAPQIYLIMFQLYSRAGLVDKGAHKRDEHRVSFLRKWFKTHMLDRGVPEKFIDYFMGHRLDTYSQVRSLGVERLREIYDKSGLSLRSQNEENEGNWAMMMNLFGDESPQLCLKLWKHQREQTQLLIGVIKEQVKQELILETKGLAVKS